ncbi:AMP-binding protein [Nocardia africana]
MPTDEDNGEIPLIARSRTTPPPAPGVTPRIILLTSGTTGTPKGAARSEPRSLAPIGALLDRVPFRAGETTTLCPPMFHTLGFAHMMLAAALGSTLVVRRRFDPGTTLDSLEHNRSTALIVVPIMLARIIESHRRRDLRPDLSALRIIYVAGSQLGPDLATQAQRTLGPVLYNMYGSTEVAYATIATPSDLAAEPACVGKPVRGVKVRILDDHGRPVPTGRTGRILVGNPYQSEGYTGGGHKDTVSGLRQDITNEEACEWLALVQLILVGRLDFEDPDDPAHRRLLETFMLPAFLAPGAA